MLVVTRKQDESLIISDDICITVLEIGKDKVKIGISAPKEVKIIRSELKDARQTNEQSASVSKSAIAELLKLHKEEE
ncbi:MAG: carbon storage regulator CsrA [Ruminococcaceae bacterium]|nr:carbon storage regulator CsrA [Oscillospiraceae bacterium]